MLVKWYAVLMFDGPVKPAYLEFIARVDEAFERATNLELGYRYGQVYFNTLCKVLPEAADKLLETNNNPFYSEEVSDITHELVELLF